MRTNGVLFDTGGTLTDRRRTHDQIGLDGLFDAFAVSAELGCNKPDPRYHTASEALGLKTRRLLLRR